MNINIKEVIPRTSERYPYSHRVEVSGDFEEGFTVSQWLDQSNIQYISTSWGVYYMKKSDVIMLLLRWS